MPTSLRNVCFDSADPYALATFWSQVVDRPIAAECEPGEEETYIEMPEGPDLFFQRVPESKIVKNRVHVCLTPETRRDEEIDRLTALGATLVDDHRNPDGTGWVVLADPEGNEFCVLRGKAERAAFPHADDSHPVTT
ncbi:VOC family protein [Micromonospora sp. KC213]|uniref:VOC family protein n=1 Tax=Micromonospora sp. KC213 TaxID=2530378 RepID=UPI00104D7F23|nr:VOC family protein [Micromonospora sp. KC213]TDC43287.1 VOC family protein [Micromonospora sp. KC213]